MNKQDIAKALFNIDWVAAEGDDPCTWDQIHYLQDQLLLLDPKEAIKLCMTVLNAKDCIAKYPKEFQNLSTFEFV